MRHKNHEDVYVKVTGEDGNVAAMINFAEHLEKNKAYINPELHECLIPFRIEFENEPSGICVGVTITVPQWYIELVGPVFKN